MKVATLQRSLSETSLNSVSESAESAFILAGASKQAFFDDERMELEELGTALARGTGPLLVEADEWTSYGTLAKVYSLAAAAGVATFSTFIAKSLPQVTITSAITTYAFVPDLTLLWLSSNGFTQLSSISV